MNLIMTITSKNNNNSYPPNIMFECSDIRNDIGLMITSTTNTTTNDNNFQLHLYDGYKDIALVINMDIRDFANMCDALGPYFQEIRNKEI